MMDWPVTLEPTRIDWELESNSFVHTSTLSNAQQVVDHAGDFWACTLYFEFLNRQTERELSAVVGSMRGMAGTVKVPTWTRERTDDIGTPVVVTANANAFIVTLGGLTASVLAFRAGDYINIGTQLFEVVKDATADGSGQAVVELNRRVRATQAAGAAVEYKAPYCIMRREEPKYKTSRRSISASSSVKLREAF